MAAGDPKTSDVKKKSLFVEAKQALHPTLLVLNELKFTLPDTIVVNMNDTWVLLFRAVIDHIFCYLGSGEVVSPAQLIDPMRSELA